MDHYTGIQCSCESMRRAWGKECRRAAGRGHRGKRRTYRSCHPKCRLIDEEHDSCIRDDAHEMSTEAAIQGVGSFLMNDKS